MQLCALAAASLRLGQRPRPGRPFLRSWPNGIGMGAWCQPDSAGNPWKSHRGCWGRGFPGCQTGPTGRVTPHGRNAPQHGARRHTALSPSPSLCPGSCPSWRPLSMVKCARPMLPLSGKLSSSCCPGRTAPPQPPRPPSCFKAKDGPCELCSQTGTDRNRGTHDRIHAAPRPTARSPELLGFPAAGKPAPRTAIPSAASHDSKCSRLFNCTSLQQGWAELLGRGPSTPGNSAWECGPLKEGEHSSPTHRAWRKPGGGGGNGGDGAGSLGRGLRPNVRGRQALPSAPASPKGRITYPPPSFPLLCGSGLPASGWISCFRSIQPQASFLNPSGIPALPA